MITIITTLIIIDTNRNYNEYNISNNDNDNKAHKNDNSNAMNAAIHNSHIENINRNTDNNINPL